MTLRLPNEVWSCIFSHITYGVAGIDDETDDIKRCEEGGSRYGTLFNLCLVSKTFRHLAEPVLYNTFTPRYGHSLVWWAHIVLNNPRFSSYVHEVEFSPLDEFDNDRDLPNEPRYQFFKDLAQNLGVNDGDQMLLRNESDDEQCAIFCSRMWLLAQVLCIKLPNLERMMIYTSSPPDLSDFWIKSGLSPPNLRELRIEWSEEYFSLSEMGIHPASLGGLLALPKLEKVHIHRCAGSWERDHLAHARDKAVQIPKNDKLRWLRFTYSIVDQNVLRKLASAFPNLETFEYLAGITGCFPGAPDPSFGSEVVSALMPLADKLKSLCLDCTGQYGHATIYSDPKYRVPSFMAFNRLEKLSVDMMLVLPRTAEGSEDGGHRDAEKTFHDYFPPSLKSLIVTHATDKLVSPLTHLSFDVRDWLPKLEEVQCQFASGVVDDDLLIKQLNSEYAGEPVFEYWGRSLPARCVRMSRYTGMIEEESEKYEPNIDIAFLPCRWKAIAECFISANIRVKIGHGAGGVGGSIIFQEFYWTNQPFESWVDLHDFVPAIEFSDRDQMFAWKWQPGGSAFFPSDANAESAESAESGNGEILASSYLTSMEEDTVDH